MKSLEPTRVTRRQTVAGYFQQLPRRQIAEDGAGRGKLIEGGDGRIVFDFPAERLEVLDERVSEFLGSPAHHGPAGRMGRKDQDHPKGGSCLPFKIEHRMRRRTGK